MKKIVVVAFAIVLGSSSVMAQTASGGATGGGADQGGSGAPGSGTGVPGAIIDGTTATGVGTSATSRKAPAVPLAPGVAAPAADPAK